MPDQMERGIDYAVELEITNYSHQDMHFRLIDGTPQTFKAEFPLRGKLSKESSTTVSYQVDAAVRGEYEIKQALFSLQKLPWVMGKAENLRIIQSGKGDTGFNRNKKGYGECSKIFIA